MYKDFTSSNDTLFSGEITGEYLLKEPLHTSKNEEIQTSRLCISAYLIGISGFFSYEEQ